MSWRDKEDKVRYLCFAKTPETAKIPSASTTSPLEAKQFLETAKDCWALGGSFVIKETTTYTLLKEEPPRT